MNTKEMIAAAGQLGLKQDRRSLTRYVADKLVGQPAHINKRVIDWQNDAPAQLVASYRTIQARRKAAEVAEAREAALYALAALQKVKQLERDPATGKAARIEISRVKGHDGRIALMVEAAGETTAAGPLIDRVHPIANKERTLEEMNPRRYQLALNWMGEYLALLGTDAAEIESIKTLLKKRWAFLDI